MNRNLLIVALLALVLVACARESEPAKVPTTSSFMEHLHRQVAEQASETAAMLDPSKKIAATNRVMLDGCRAAFPTSLEKCDCFREAIKVGRPATDVCDSRGAKKAPVDEEDDDSDTTETTATPVRFEPLPAQLVGAVDSQPLGWNSRLGIAISATPSNDCNLAVAINGVYVQWGTVGFGPPRIGGTRAFVPVGTGMPMRDRSGSVVAGDQVSFLPAGHRGFIDLQRFVGMSPNNLHSSSDVQLDMICYAVSSVLVNAQGMPRQMIQAVAYQQGGGHHDYHVPGALDLTQYRNLFWDIMMPPKRPIWR